MECTPSFLSVLMVVVVVVVPLGSFPVITVPLHPPLVFSETDAVK